METGDHDGSRAYDPAAFLRPWPQRTYCSNFKRHLTKEIMSRHAVLNMERSIQKNVPLASNVAVLD